MARQPRVSQLEKALEKFRSQPLGLFTTKELKQIGLPMIRAARKKMRELEQEGLAEYSSAYIGMKEFRKVDVSVAGNDIRKLRKEVNAAFNFLTETVTSDVEGALRQKRQLEHWFGDITAEQRKGIFRVITLIESTHAQHFQNYGYHMQHRLIGEFVKDQWILSGIDEDSFDAEEFNAEEIAMKYRRMLDEHRYSLEEDYGEELSDEASDVFRPRNL